MYFGNCSNTKPVANEVKPMHRRLAVLLAAVLLVAAGCGGVSGGGSAQLESLPLMAPAAPGGGWDQTTRAVQEVLEQEGIVSGIVEVINVPGAGGTVGLAQPGQ